MRQETCREGTRFVCVEKIIYALIVPVNAPSLNKTKVMRIVLAYFCYCIVQ